MIGQVRYVLMCCALFSSALFAAEITVTLRNFEFVPNDITIQVGDTVRFVNEGGFHDVLADDGSFGNTAASAPWEFTQTFDSAGEVLVHCSIHSSPGASIDSNMNARITVEEGPSFTINQGLSGAWFNFNTRGQGILFDIEPGSQFIFGAIFTYETAVAAKLGAPEHRWLTLQGNYQGNTAQVPIFVTSGGVFDQPVPTTTVPIGNATVVFESCTSATLGYELDDPPLSGSIALQRVIPGTEALCQQLEAAAASNKP